MNANNEDLPDRVRRERQRRDWTQKDMAKRVGMSVRAYQNFETRKGSPQGANLRAILRAVDLDPEGEDVAETTREDWPRDIRVFLDVMGAYLATMGEADRLETMHRLTRQIFEGRLT